MNRNKHLIEQALVWFMRTTGLLIIGVMIAASLQNVQLRPDRQQTAKWIFSMWKFNYPGISLIDPNAEPSADHIIEQVWNLQPVYRFSKKTPEQPRELLDEDPSYFTYRSQEVFYQEHEYLFRYGNEDSNASEYPVVEEAPELLADATKTTPVHTAAVQLPVIGNQYVKEQLADYDFLMKHFYSVHSSTTADRKLMNAQNLLAKDLKIQTANDQPQILIYHTHSQEFYADYDAAHPERSVVGVGTYLTELLEAKGYQVIHDTSVYDLKNNKLDRNHAYNYALEGITEILQQNPSIDVVLDLHRDGVKESLHMVSEVNGKQTAPIMFFHGLSQTPEGPIEYLQNPYREDNLAFSLQLQLNAAAYFPGLTRKIYLKGLRYNQHLRAKSVLIEVGAQTNTYEEAYNAMEPLAELLDMVLQGN